LGVELRPREEDTRRAAGGGAHHGIRRALPGDSVVVARSLAVPRRSALGFVFLRATDRQTGTHRMPARTCRHVRRPWAVASLWARPSTCFGPDGHGLGVGLGSMRFRHHLPPPLSARPRSSRLQNPTEFLGRAEPERDGREEEGGGRARGI
jgi:hypothetical protein